MGLDRVGPPPGRIAVTGRWLRGLAGSYSRVARRRSSSRWRVISCSRYECIDVGPSPGDPWGPVSPPSRRAGGKVTAWRLSGRCDHRLGRAPWPGPRRGPAGRAARPHASGARAGPSAGGYESAALFLISLAGHPIPWGPVAGSRARWTGSWGTVRIAACVGRHPKVPARWNIAVRRSVTPKVLRADWGVSEDQAQLLGLRGGPGPVGGADHVPLSVQMD
jgi:hypothetical protein